MAAREGYAELQAKTSEARRVWKRIGFLIYKFLVQPLISSLTLRDVALNVERKHPALQFGERESADRTFID